MLEKRSISSNETSDSQSRRTDNDLRQSISRFTKKLLSHVTCCVSPRDESQPHEQDSTSRASESGDQRPPTEKARDLLRKNIKSVEDIIIELGDKLDEKTKERYGELFSLLGKRAGWNPCEMHKQLAEDSQAILETLKTKNIKAIQDLVKGLPDKPAKTSSHPFDLEKPLAKPSDKLLDRAHGAVPKEWVHPNDAVDYLVKGIKKALQEEKKIGLMFDIDYTLLDPREVKSGTNNWKMPSWWLEAVKKLQKYNIKIAINTGRSTKDIDQAFENADAMELRNSLYLFGEDSNMYKKPDEGWKLIYPEAQIYVEPTKEIRNKIKNEIKKNEMLTKLEIDAEKIILDQTIGVTFPKWLVWFRMQENFEKNQDVVFNQLRSISKKVVDEYPDFILDYSENKGLEICPKGIRKAHKGNGTETFIRENGLSKFLAFGDDKPDVAMVSKAHLLAAANEFIKDNEKLAQDERLRGAFIQASIKRMLDKTIRIRSALTQDSQISHNLEQREMLKTIKTFKTKDALNKEFHEKLYASTPKTELEDHALIAVRHPSDMNSGKTLQDAYRQEQAANIVHDAATIKINGIEALQDLLEEVANKLDK